LTNISHNDKDIVIMTDSLFEETRLLFHALKQWVESLHGGREITVPMRAVLELLLRAGPRTVPEMARARGVSRQHIQQQVDELLGRGLAERRDNPAHRRSVRIALTDEGRALIQDMRAHELDRLSRLQAGVSDHAVREATQVLGAWRSALQEDLQRRSG
jgi:DNA-binding MarR family transcriptional regulator